MSSRAGVSWTKREVAALRDAVIAGDNVYAVAALDGRSEHSIRGRLRRMQEAGEVPCTIAPRREWTAEEDAALAHGYMDGVSQADLARQLGRAWSSTTTRIKILRQTGKIADPLVDAVVVLAMSAPWGPASTPGRLPFADHCGRDW